MYPTFKSILTLIALASAGAVTASSNQPAEKVAAKDNCHPTQYRLADRCESADVTLGFDSIRYMGDTSYVYAQICNLGTQSYPVSAPLSIYTGDPRQGGASLIAIAQTSKAIQPGSCLGESFILPRLCSGTDYFFIISDNGESHQPIDLAIDFPNSGITECDYTNNIISISDQDCDNLNVDPDVSSSVMDLDDHNNVEQGIFANSIRISPNPNAGIFRLELENGIAVEKVDVRLYDSRGRMVLADVQSAGKNSLTINIASEPNGVYVLKVQMGSKHVTQRIAKL